MQMQLTEYKLSAVIFLSGTETGESVGPLGDMATEVFLALAAHNFAQRSSQVE
jgi:hypothetical protein